MGPHNSGSETIAELLGGRAMTIAANVLSSVADDGDRAALGDISLSNGEMKIGPLHYSYRIAVNAYARGRGHGDDSTAYLRLYADDGEVAYSADQAFDSYDLSIDHSFILAAGRHVVLRMDHNNSRADETAYGMTVTGIQPI
jgi:hypothetical protein